MHRFCPKINLKAPPSHQLWLSSLPLQVPHTRKKMTNLFCHIKDDIFMWMKKYPLRTPASCPQVIFNTSSSEGFRYNEAGKQSRKDFYYSTFDPNLYAKLSPGACMMKLHCLRRKIWVGCFVVLFFFFFQILFSGRHPALQMALASQACAHLFGCADPQSLAPCTAHPNTEPIGWLTHFPSTASRSKEILLKWLLPQARADCTLTTWEKTDIYPMATQIAACTRNCRIN